MSDGHWLLVVESNESDRNLIGLAAKSVAPTIEIHFVGGYDEFVSAIGARRCLPTVAVLDWFAGGGSASSCLDTLSSLGLLARLPIIATARENQIEALKESMRLGAKRFVSKFPDDQSFKKKVAEAISYCVPGAKKVQPPTSVL